MQVWRQTVEQMMHSLTYEDIPPVSREEAEAKFAGTEPGQTAFALLSLSLHDPDPHWVLQQCLRFLSHSDEVVVSAAIRAIGHTSRIHHISGGKTIIQALRAVGADPRYSGKVQDTLDDIEIFANR